jgi:hypothetical protein
MEALPLFPQRPSERRHKVRKQLVMVTLRQGHQQSHGPVCPKEYTICERRKGGTGMHCSCVNESVRHTLPTPGDAADPPFSLTLHSLRGTTPRVMIVEYKTRTREEKREKT